MAISFGRALLAGAAGVANYSNQEQQRRQKRLDRVAELQDRLGLEVAKSKYAAKYNRYEDNLRAKKALGDTDPNSTAGQIILGQVQTGMSRAEVLQLAANGSRWTLEDVKEPTITMPETVAGQKAISPIQDWLKGYRGDTQHKERLAEYQREIGGRFTPVGDEIPDERPQPAEVTTAPRGTEAPVDPQGSIEPIGTTDATVEPEMEPMAATTNAATDEDFAKLIPKPEVKWEVTKQDGVKEGVKGKYVSFTDPDTLKTNTVFIGNNQVGTKMIDPLTQELADGGKVMTDRFLDLESGEVTLGTKYKIKAGTAPDDTESPVELVELEDYAEFMQPKTDNQRQGQFFSVFPPNERETWENTLGKGEGMLGFFDETPKGFEDAMGRAYLDNKKGTIDAGILVNYDLNNPEIMSGFESLWKAQAYIKNLGVDRLAELINMEDGLDKSMFYGDVMNGFPEIQKLHNRIGITEDTDRELYNKLTMRSTAKF